MGLQFNARLNDGLQKYTNKKHIRIDFSEIYFARAYTEYGFKLNAPLSIT